MRSSNGVFVPAREVLGRSRSRCWRRRLDAPLAPRQAGPTVVWAVGDAATPNGGAAPCRAYPGDAAGPLPLPGRRLRARHRSRSSAANYQPVSGAAPDHAPTPGNHEWGPAHRLLPVLARAQGRPSRPSTVLGSRGWEILSLNSETAHGAGSRQLRWLRRRSRARGNCRIAFWHRPPLQRRQLRPTHRTSSRLAALRGHAGPC